ncbi:L-lysine 2,3-aminomutase [Variibacter gotjawalensis]|uniref:L-lysine 2,3-aminomutase n=1 Tax=Variibacter gotjawalensis TaxID=1333996 RepID=A0A0S3PSX8_9BRAD|nr:lysine-2,3-aminomutase-like protein [Variibacter gotjawalensis]NIK49388.1 lysine 2,3-aminomutase [Variibacter gotjawalensis]RZS51240.1 L-lysine 2,3-aminomutase [Variibacter gotjawalensis]BAT59073.1 L-lysine 2,3-aminomutase [Variibacter gotjawalensis]
MHDIAEKTLRSADELVSSGLAPRERRDDLARVGERYAAAITPAMTELIDRTDAADPIARQFVPDFAELTITDDEHADPIGDDAHTPVKGIVHRYPDRVLLKLVNVCAVYCRFCFRREMVGPGKKALSDSEISAALDYVRARPEIWEVILTGGDPLVMAPRRLAAVIKQIAAIPHVKIVRLHTRIPSVAPERVTPAMVRALKAPGATTYLVLHANHARELTEPARGALGRLADAGIPLLSQSVLLRGVNDSVEVLADLMRAFVESRVKPYYLHHPDLAPGTGHFRITIKEGQELVRQLHGRVSGLCQPTYVLDIPGGFGKSPIGPSYLDEAGAVQTVKDYQGQSHPYSKV